MEEFGREGHTGWLRAKEGREREDGEGKVEREEAEYWREGRREELNFQMVVGGRRAKSDRKLRHEGK